MFSDNLHSIYRKGGRESFNEMFLQCISDNGGGICDRLCVKPVVKVGDMGLFGAFIKYMRANMSIIYGYVVCDRSACELALRCA